VPALAAPPEGPPLRCELDAQTSAAAGEERLRISAGAVASVLWTDLAFRLTDEEIAHIAASFAFDGAPSSLGEIDGDVLVDALRGNVSVGRREYLRRAYDLLRKEEGVLDMSMPLTSLARRMRCDWMEEVRSGRVAEREMWEILMPTLPIVRKFELVTPESFVRLNEDLTCHIDRVRPEFVAAVRAFWGVEPELTAEEEQQPSGGETSTPIRRGVPYQAAWHILGCLIRWKCFKSIHTKHPRKALHNIYCIYIICWKISRWKFQARSVVVSFQPRPWSRPFPLFVPRLFPFPFLSLPVSFLSFPVPFPSLFPFLPCSLSFICSRPRRALRLRARRAGRSVDSFQSRVDSLPRVQ